jgi:beta-glucosidase/6-phospho-beta-glucosidase/beta-galactosidase
MDLLVSRTARSRPNPSTERFIFATGIECSYPTIETDQGRRRIDQPEKADHYNRWKEDFELTKEMGIRYLRYGLPYYSMHKGPGKFDWEFADEVMNEMRDMGIIPILDLCHFGVPDWLENFQNPELVTYFPQWCRAVAERYPWVWLYTPINEMYIAAEFSAYYGWWNEMGTTDKTFVTALKHIVRANFDAMLQILEVRPDAQFVQAESSEHFHANNPELVERAEFLNERRFLTLDLTYGKHVDATMYEYLLDNGMTRDEYAYFHKFNLREHCVIGNDYYISNEHLVTAPDKHEASGEVFGYYVVTRSYYDRYNLPVMHTETNLHEPNAVNWLWKTWTNIQQLRFDGVPLCGMTWYSLIDQVDWDTALREENNRVNPLGLYDMDRNIRAVGKAYKRLIEQWAHIPLLPNGPLSLRGDWGLLHEDEDEEEAGKDSRSRSPAEALQRK